MNPTSLNFGSITTASPSEGREIKAKPPTRTDVSTVSPLPEFSVITATVAVGKTYATVAVDPQLLAEQRQIEEINKSIQLRGRVH